jgi:hypothetical protein
VSVYSHVLLRLFLKILVSFCLFSANQEEQGTTLHLDFELQTAIRGLSIKADPLAMWTCHWGARSVSVHGGFRFMDRTEQTSELQGMVAVGLRDGTPFAIKARIAQVLYVSFI